MLFQEMERRKQILIVDDNIFNIEVLKNFIEVNFNNRFNLEIALSGQNAVTKASEMFFDYILMDINMPLMSGFEASRIITSS